MTESLVMDALAAFRIELQIYSQYKVPVVIVKVWAPVLVLFYISMIYNKYCEIAGFAFCNNIQVCK